MTASFSYTHLLYILRFARLADRPDRFWVDGRAAGSKAGRSPQPVAPRQPYRYENTLSRFFTPQIIHGE